MRVASIRRHESSASPRPIDAIRPALPASRGRTASSPIKCTFTCVSYPVAPSRPPLPPSTRSRLARSPARGFRRHLCATRASAPHGMRFRYGRSMCDPRIALEMHPVTSTSNLLFFFSSSFFLQRRLYNWNLNSDARIWNFPGVINNKFEN